MLSESALDRAGAEAIDGGFRSFPAAEGVTIATVGQQGWTAFGGQLASPVLLLKHRELEHNLATMADFCGRHGILLAPHAKTTMSPQLVQRQFAHGAWGVTVATVSQARTLIRLGARRVIVANQVVDTANLRMLAELRRGTPGLEIWVLVDSLDAVRLMDAELARHAPDLPPLPVLVEFGYDGGRAGERAEDRVRGVADAVAASARLELAGIEGYEGLMPGDDAESRRAAVVRYLDGVRAAFIAWQREGLLAVDAILSFGGSAYQDLVAEVLASGWLDGAAPRVVLRSGCYVTHDHGLYAESSPWSSGERMLEPALELWATVLSRPSAELAIVGFGRRDAPYDSGLPVVLGVGLPGEQRHPDGLVATALNDQHAHVRVPPGVVLEVGEWMAFGISHPCTAFDKWTLIPIVDDDYRVVDAVRTHFS